MTLSDQQRNRRKLISATLTVPLLAASFVAQVKALSGEKVTPDAWNKTQLVMPEELAKVLSEAGGKKPLVVCVGFEPLYRTAHIPGAKIMGPGRDAKGIEALKTWARSMPRESDVVIYCGCCPFKECPNIRPAFEALHQVGLTRLKVLYLESNFAKDWLEKGLAVEKGAGVK